MKKEQNSTKPKREGAGISVHMTASKLHQPDAFCLAECQYSVSQFIDTAWHNRRFVFATASCSNVSGSVLLTSKNFHQERLSLLHENE